MELRRAYERSLIGAWRAGLVAGGVTDYTEADAWEDYRRGVLYVWVIAVVIAGTWTPPTNGAGAGSRRCSPVQSPPSTTSI